MASHGTINVNIDMLASMLHTLNRIQFDLGIQSASISTLSASLSTVLSGSSVQTFETNFASWVSTLNDLVEDIQATYSVLDSLLIDLEIETVRLNAIHFTN